MSVGMNAAIALKDNGMYYDETLALGKKRRQEQQHQVAAVPVEEED